MSFARIGPTGTESRHAIRRPRRTTVAVEALEARRLLDSGMDPHAMAMPADSPPAGVPAVYQQGQPFRDPPQIASRGRVLNVKLVAGEQAVQIGGRSIVGRVYNGAFVGPTLHVKPGDTLVLNLVNTMKETTNLHFHGLHVPPSGNADNIFREIAPGKTARYVLHIPKNHPTGTFWYHSHDMMMGEEQVFGGMSGALIVDGLSRLLPPALRHITEHTFDLKDFQVDSSGEIVKSNIDSNAPTTRTVNGQINPVLTMHPGETQLWHLANVGADIFYDLHLDGNVFHVIAEDGNPVNSAWTASDLVMAPGKRYDVLVQAGPAGTTALRTLAYSTGSAGDNYPDTVLATVVTQGTPGGPAALPQVIKPFHDLRADTVAASKTLIFTENQATNSQFFINHKPYDLNRIDEVSKLNTTEEWTIYNGTDEQHPFHLHTDPFQVISINGQPVDAHSVVDTQILPPNGQIKIRVHFSDYRGKTVYHCHIMHHEESGMMGNLQIV
jgi:suppressor of ftsI